MTDLRERLRAIDTVEAPDLWDRVGSSSTPWSRRRDASRLMATVAALLVAVAGTVVGIRAFGTGRTGTPTPDGIVTSPTGPPVESSANASLGELQCTAKLTHSILTPGARVRLIVVVKNVSDRPVRFPSGTAWFRIQDDQGRELWDGGRGFINNEFQDLFETDLKPGEVEGLLTEYVTIRWPGKLRFLPVCPLGVNLELPAIDVTVATSGLVPSEAAAVARAAKWSSLFKGCRPVPGEEIRGRIKGFSSRCWARTEKHQGFRLVHLIYAQPPEAPMIEVPLYIDDATLPKGISPLAYGRQTFVVTQAGVHEATFGDRELIQRREPREKKHRGPSEELRRELRELLDRVDGR